MPKNANVICEGSLLEEVSFESVKLNDLTLTFAAVNEILVDEEYGSNSSTEPQVLQNISWLPMVSYIKV